MAPTMASRKPHGGATRQRVVLVAVVLAAFATGLVLAYRQRAEAIRSQRNQLELARNAALVARRAKEARKAERLVLQPSDDVQAHDAQDIADALDPTLHHPPPAVPPSPKMTREAEIAQEEYFCFTIRYEPSVYELAKQAGFDMERRTGRSTTNTCNALSHKCVATAKSSLNNHRR